MPACQGKFSNGKPCPKAVEEDQTYCRWHDPEDESWREIYYHLSYIPYEDRTEFVLHLIEEHPEHRLVLPERDGLPAELWGIDLSKDTIVKIIKQSGFENPPYWSELFDRLNLGSADLQGAEMMHAKLQKAFLGGANLQDAILSHANLQGAHLGWANLQGTDLENANLQGTFLRDSNLRLAKLIGTDIRGSDLTSVNFQGADLRGAKLQGVDLTDVIDLTNIFISDAWLDRTRIRKESLGGMIGEELEGDYVAAKRGYLALKQNFDDLGDYDAESWAYRKERRMEKLEARQKGRSALKERKWGEVLASYFKFLSDLVVEALCDYGESVWRVIGWMAVLLLIVGPFLFSALGGFLWPGNLLEDYFALPSLWHQFWYRYFLYLLYTLDALTTASFSGLEPGNTAVKLASGFFSITGIFLVGLLGFVAGNRIRRS